MNPSRFPSQHGALAGEAPEIAGDTAADTDANFVMTGAGRIVEVQGTAEKIPFTEEQFQYFAAAALAGPAAGVGVAMVVGSMLLLRARSKPKLAPGTIAPLACCAWVTLIERSPQDFRHRRPIPLHIAQR
jgi:hypothetical protein